MFLDCNTFSFLIKRENSLLLVSLFFFSSSFVSFHLFLISFIFYWRINALQNLTAFCQTLIWISHRYIYISSLSNLSPISLPILPPSIDTKPMFEFPEPYNKFLLAIYFTYGKVSFHVTLSIYLTLSSPLPMSINLLSMSISSLLPCK